jgi:hypothetical protein
MSNEVQMKNFTYLGDGVYAQFDPAQTIILSTPRADEPTNAWGVHWVGLEPEVFMALIQFAHKIGWGDIIKAAAPSAAILSDKEYAEAEERDERIRNQREYEGD